MKVIGRKVASALYVAVGAYCGYVLIVTLIVVARR